MEPDRDEVVVSRGRLGLGEGVGGWDQIEPTCGMFTQQQCCGNVGRSWIAESCSEPSLVSQQERLKFES